jgi:ribonuclease HI
VTGTPSNNRAELYSILLTVQKTPLHRVLDIFTDSTYVIHSLVHWSIRNAKCGWVCANGDLLRLITSWIAARSAPIRFHHVKGHSGNRHNDAADALAKHGAELPLPIPFSPTDYYHVPAPIPFTVPLGHPKVHTDLPEDSSPDKPHPSRQHSFHRNHRHRSFKRQLQDGILHRLIECSSNSGAFWRLYKRLRYPGNAPTLVSLSSLAECFIPRMNPPKNVPQPLQDRLTRECNLCERVKVSKPSIFPTLNERLTIHDIERAKAHLMQRKPSRATGVDGSTYSWILNLDNQILCDLLNSCVDAGEVPSAWLTTLIKLSANEVDATSLIRVNTVP